MKNITFIFLFLGTIGFAQNLGNPATIGQTNRNQKVGKGLQVEDTLLTKGKVIFSNLVTYGSADTFLAIKNGYLVRALSSGGGGSSALFPNGIKMVTESRDFEADDVGHILVVASSNIHLTMPLGITFEDNKILGIKLFGGITNVGYESLNGILINPFIDASDGEFITLYTTDFAGNSNLVQISGNNVYDNGVFKTALRYLYDKVNANGDIFITKTKAEIDALISTSTLLKGATYKITGVHPTLYNDGTNSGTTILLKAISENVLETQGTGIFYNPKYNQAVDGFGIWDNKMYGTFSTIVGTFDYQNKETVTADNSATGILLSNGMIQYVSGNWSSATSITGDVSSATANVADFVSPSYAVNDKVIWGGYSWTNVNGNIGASTDVLNLDSEWIKDVYDTTNYNLAYDVIEYDYANDWISRRYEIASNVDVKITKSIYAYFAENYGIIYSSISVQQFGNSFDYSIGKGILNKYLDNAYDESINFSGSIQNNLTFGAGSNQYNLTFGQNSIQNNLTFGAGSNQYNLTFGQNSSQNNLTFGAGSNQYNLTFGQNSSQNNLTFGAGSNQYNLTFGQNSSQNNLTFGAGSIQYNLIFGQSSNQQNLIFGAYSSQQNLTFGQSSSQSNLTFGTYSNQNNLTFGQGSIQYNLTFGKYSQLYFNNQTLNSNMEFIDFKTKNFTVPDLSSATYIFDGNIKEVYQRPDGAIKLKFMNDLDVLEVHGIAD